MSEDDYGEVENQTLNELMALKMAFIIPVIFSGIFLLLDAYHVYIEVHYAEIDTWSKMQFFALSALRAINSYFPATLFTIVLFATIQQGFYHVFSGFVVSKMDTLLIFSVVYAMLYAVYIVQGSDDFLLLYLMSMMTIIFGFMIFQSLEDKVKTAREEWKKVAGSNSRIF